MSKLCTYGHFSLSEYQAINCSFGILAGFILVEVCVLEET